MLENTIISLNVLPLIKTTFVVLEHSLKHPLVLVSLGIISVIVGVKYRNYLKMKNEHIDRLVKNVLNRWKGITCEMPPSYAINREYISLGEFKSIQRSRDYVFAMQHLKNYSCYEVWERTMKLISSLNKTANGLFIEIDKTIAYRLNRKVFTSGIYIVQSQIIFDSIVKALIADVDINQGCNGYIRIDEREKAVRTDLGVILAEGGSTQDLVVFNGIICDIISNKYYRENIRRLHLQFENIVKKNIKDFKKQLRKITTIAEHNKKLRGRCEACPIFLLAFGTHRSSG